MILSKGEAKREMWRCTLLPVVLVGKCVEVSFLLVDEILETFVDRRAAVAYFLQDGLEDHHVANHGVLQNIDLWDAKIMRGCWKIHYERNICANFC